MRLDPAAAAAGFRLLAYERLPSTNAEALSLARGAEAPTWITAREQTAGRGRRGNAWISPPGNLYATLLLTDPAPPRRAPELSFVAALAVHDAILGCAPSLRGQLALKWPNDVLCDGAKLAGILIESHTLDPGFVVAIGVGINCVSRPPETFYPATDLATAGAAIAADDLFAALSAAMDRRLRQWNGGGNFAAIRAGWIERATGLGGDLLVRLPGREISGRYQALDDAGRLVLRLPDGSLETIAAGDVFPVAAAKDTVRTRERRPVD